MNYKRIYIEKEKEYDARASELLGEFRGYLKLKNLKDLRIVDLYDIYDISEEEKNL